MSLSVEFVVGKTALSDPILVGKWLCASCPLRLVRLPSSGEDTDKNTGRSARDAHGLLAERYGKDAEIPKLLLLDEAQSDLDPINEDKLNKMLKKLQHEKQITIVLIAHRFKTISNCDYIIYMGPGGTVLQQGSREEVFDDEAGPFWQKFRAGADELTTTTPPSSAVGSRRGSLGSTSASSVSRIPPERVSSEDKYVGGTPFALKKLPSFEGTTGGYEGTTVVDIDELGRRFEADIDDALASLDHTSQLTKSMAELKQAAAAASAGADLSELRFRGPPPSGHSQHHQHSGASSSSSGHTPTFGSGGADQHPDCTPTSGSAKGPPRSCEQCDDQHQGPQAGSAAEEPAHAHKVVGKLADAHAQAERSCRPPAVLAEDGPQEEYRICTNLPRKEGSYPVLTYQQMCGVLQDQQHAVPAGHGPLSSSFDARCAAEWARLEPAPAPTTQVGANDAGEDPPEKAMRTCSQAVTEYMQTTRQVADHDAFHSHLHTC